MVIGLLNIGLSPCFQFSVYSIDRTNKYRYVSSFYVQLLAMYIYDNTVVREKFVSKNLLVKIFHRWYPPTKINHMKYF